MKPDFQPIVKHGEGRVWIDFGHPILVSVLTLFRTDTESPIWGITSGDLVRGSGRNMRREAAADFGDRFDELEIGKFVQLPIVRRGATLQVVQVGIVPHGFTEDLPFIEVAPLVPTVAWWIGSISGCMRLQ